MGVEKDSPKVLGMSYEEMLDRALKSLPNEIKTPSGVEIPKAEIFHEAGRTIITNWREILTKLNREERIVLRYLEHRLGTVGWVIKGRAVLQGLYKRSRINKLLELFAKEYVICDVCGRPHTVLYKEKGQLIKKCEACGAWRVVERI
ncbi:MAG: translation initiation factor IF-2 subunit beta [Candidatus Njordarchaeales archaeon]